MGGIPRSRITGLLFRAHELPESPEKLDLCREAVRLADLRGELDLRFTTRLWLIQAATFQDRPELALVEMSFCLGLHEQDPEKYDGMSVFHGGEKNAYLYSEMGIHWALKWVLASLDSFPGIRRDQIESTFEQVSGLYRRRGLNLHPIHGLRAAAARRMGDEDLARAETRLWRETPPDRGADCPACETAHEVDARLWEGRDEEAVELAEPLATGALRCRGGQENSMSDLLVPLVRLGRGERAIALHERGRRIDFAIDGRLLCIPPHILFMAVVGGWERGWRMARDEAGRALSQRDGRIRLEFESAWRCLLESGLARGGPRRYPGPLPAALDSCRVGDRYDAEGLVDLLTVRIDRTTAAFDERNGNHYVRRRIEEERNVPGELWSPSLCRADWR